ncbi:MAG: YidC/Oxa1 family membrane protein insertase [Chloroflexi bacterium]|nr:YidC/Oxa1 family membrane protein insertase [Chloroflexota bacterium]
MLDFVGLIWNQLILGPMVNSLVFLYVILFHNFGLSILVFTVIIRLVTMPLTLKQIRMTRGMSQIQPLVKALQQKYANDKASLSRETMALYKTHGVNPLGCLGPMFIQMPIWIGLYQGIIQTLPAQPEKLIGLSQKLYSWLPFVNEAVPLNSKFLWLDLALGPGEQNDFLLPALVGLSMWAVQKMSTVPSADARQAQTNQMMLWMMPLMLTFFSFQLPSGLALYWVASNLIQMGIQYFITGWGNLLPSRKTGPAPQTAPAQPVKEIVQDGNNGSDGKNSRGSNRDRPGTARRRTRSGRNRRNQPR